jgi:glycosyltransferase involved in cell wall biosynthesis
LTILEVTAAPFGAGRAGGGERHAIEFIRELSRHEPVVASYAVRARKSAPAVGEVLCPAHFISFPPVFSTTNPLPGFASWGVIGSYLRTHRGEIEFVHVHNLRTAMSTLWLLLTYLRKKDDHLRILLTDHGARFFPLPQLTIQMVDAYVPVSRQSEQLLLKLAERPSRIVPTAVSSEFLDGRPLGFSERSIHLLWVGRFVPWKRPDRVLQLTADLGRRLQRPVQTVITGAGVDPAFLGELRRRAQELGITDNVRFVVGPSDAELIALYSHAKVYCLASDTVDMYGRHNALPELSPITVLEAAARGTPALANGIPAGAEQVREGVTGHLVSPFGGPHSIDLAERMVTDPAHWTTLSTGAREFVERERTYPQTVQRFRAFLTELRRNAA